MTAPDAVPPQAIEAAARAAAIFDDYDGCFIEPDMAGQEYDEDRKWWRDRAEAALAAAYPAIREHFAQELDQRVERCACPTADCYRCAGVAEAASIVRGGDR